MKTAVIFCFVVVLALSSVQGKIFNRCELARALKAQGFPLNELPDWVCLVESESSRNTGIRGGPNKNGSYDYGLFQINGRYWCTVGRPGNDCNVDCNKLLDDDITDDSRCAKLVYRRHGFDAWYGWLAKCQGALPDLRGCGI